MPMKNPPHPWAWGSGELVWTLLGLALPRRRRFWGWLVTPFCGFGTATPGISPDMDIRLEKAGWSGADFWLKRQTASDLAQGRKDRV